MPPLRDLRRKDDELVFTEEVLATPTPILSSKKAIEDQRTPEATSPYPSNTADIAMAAEVLLELSSPVNRYPFHYLNDHIIKPEPTKTPAEFYRIATFPIINTSEASLQNDRGTHLRHRSLSQSSRYVLHVIA